MTDWKLLSKSETLWTQKSVVCFDSTSITVLFKYTRMKLAKYICGQIGQLRKYTVKEAKFVNRRAICCSIAIDTACRYMYPYHIIDHLHIPSSIVYYYVDLHFFGSEGLMWLTKEPHKSERGPWQ